MFQEERDYDAKYGSLPNTREELAEHLRHSHKIDMAKVEQEIERISNIEWKTIEFLIPIVPKGSPRPKYSSKTRRFYVKGAKKTKKILEKYFQEYGIICTRTELELIAYQPMPSSMTITETYLAELGYIRPIQKPDFDNLAKSYTDPMEEELILNDILINPAHIHKYFSIKPRIHLILRYQTEFDSAYNRKKIESSLGYRTQYDTRIRREDL